MSTALFIVLESEIPGFDPMVNGQFLAQATEELDATAAELKVKPLMSFFSQDPGEAADFLEDEDIETDGIAIPDETWFSAADGLATVDALLKHFQKDPNSPPQSADVIHDLEEFQGVLRRAESEGVGWHLDVDF